MPFLRFALVPLLALGLAAPVAAQVPSPAPLTVHGDGLVLDTMGQRLQLPRPSWMAAIAPDADLDAAFDSRFVSDDSQALLELYPKGQTPALWTQRFGARVGRDTGHDMAAYRDAVVQLYAGSCQRQRMAFFQLGQDNGDQLAPLGFVCGAYSAPLFADLGEVMVVSFRRSGDTVGFVYQEWRGDAFDPADPASWPVPTEQVQARALELQLSTALSAAN